MEIEHGGRFPRPYSDHCIASAKHAGIETKGYRFGNSYLAEIGVRWVHEEIRVPIDDCRGNLKRQRLAASSPVRTKIAANEAVQFAPIWRQYRFIQRFDEFIGDCGLHHQQLIGRLAGVQVDEMCIRDRRTSPEGPVCLGRRASCFVVSRQRLRTTDIKLELFRRLPSPCASTNAQALALIGTPRQFSPALPGLHPGYSFLRQRGQAVGDPLGGGGVSLGSGRGGHAGQALRAFQQIDQGGEQLAGNV